VVYQGRAENLGVETRDDKIARPGSRAYPLFYVSESIDSLRFNHDSVCSRFSPVEILPLSLPHRLLVILLRRGLLEDHTSIDSLLNGNEHRVRIKDDALELPVFYGAQQNGLYICTKPLAVSALTAYMKRRTM